MVDTTSKWEDELGRWLEPFLDRLGHKARRRMCPLYVAGLIGPGDRKSVQPMAARLDERSGAFEACWRSSRTSRGADQAKDRTG
jgi:SRSO17 transposase